MKDDFGDFDISSCIEFNAGFSVKVYGKIPQKT